MSKSLKATKNKGITVGYVDCGKDNFISTVAINSAFLEMLGNFAKVIVLKDKDVDFTKLKKKKVDYLLLDMRMLPLRSLILREKARSDMPCIIILHTIWDWMDTLLFMIPLIRKEDVIIAPSKYAREFFLKITKKFDVHVVPYCLDVREIRKTVSFEPEKNKKTLCFMGRVVKEKGIGTLLECMPDVIAKTGDVRLNIIGPLSGALVTEYPKSEYVKELEIKIKDLGLARHIVFRGAKMGAEKYRALSEADIFVSPTTFKGETFNIANLEAMACGLPVVTTKWGAHKEFIGQGKNGRMVDVVYDGKNKKTVVDNAGLGDAIIRLLTDNALLSKMKKTAYKSAMNFDMGKVIPGFIALLKKKNRAGKRRYYDWNELKKKTVLDFSRIFRKDMIFSLCLSGMAYWDYEYLEEKTRKSLGLASKMAIPDKPSSGSRPEEDALIKKIRFDMFQSMVDE